jgi:hypothetical protein
LGHDTQIKLPLVGLGGSSPAGRGYPILFGKQETMITTTFVIKTVLAQRGQHNFLSYWPEVGTLAHRKGKRRGGVDLTFKEKKPSI